MAYCNTTTDLADLISGLGIYFQEKKQLPETSAVPHHVFPEASSRTAPDSISKVQEKEVEVDTPLFKAVFSNVGPTIRSFRLREYYHDLRSLMK